MFSCRFLELCGYILRKTRFCSVIAIQYDKKRYIFCYRPISYPVVINAVFYISTLIFWIYRAIEAKLSRRKSDFNSSLIFVLTGILGSGTWITTLFNAKSTASIINAFVKWTWGFQEHWMPYWDYKTSITGKLLEDFVCVTGVLLVIIVQVMIVIQHFIFPETTCFFSSLIPLEYRNRWTMLLSMMMFQFHGLIFTINMLLICLIGLCYLCVMVPLIMKEFRPYQSNYMTSNRLRRPYNLIHTYRTVEIVHGMALDMIGKLILPYYTIAGQFVLFCNVSALREERLDLVMVVYSFISQFVIFIALEFAGRFSKNAILTVQSWKNFDCSYFDKKCLNKFRKSCNPLRFETKGYFVIKRLTVLKFLRSVVRGTFRAVLTLSKTRKL